VRLRAFRRAVALGSALAACVLNYWLMRLYGAMTMERRALWLQQASRGVLASLGIRTRVKGEAPKRGLIVSNHLSYLDILILSAAAPCFFVSKAEIDRWPYFGRAARAGGTIFIVRGNRASAEATAAEIAQRLTMAVPVLLFPEGTSTDGSRVSRFHSRLMQPAIAAGAPVTPAAVRYTIEGGVPERELCWYGDAAFLPHLWKALGTAGFSADLRFGEPHVYTDRHVAAARTHAEVEAMRGDGLRAVH
jgi:1-acyl-sn-glycerol-3-phosphate acyltransferase